MKKYGWIDAIRGYAILGVVIVHCFMGDKGIFGSNILGIGAKGVQLFYIASAYTLLLSWNNRKKENRPSLNFFIRRFFRIAPMFWLAILFWLIYTKNEIYTPGYDYRYYDYKSIIAHFLFLHGFSPFWQDSLVPGGWSVGVEFIFYFLCPFLFTRINNLKKAFWAYLFALYIGYICIIILKKFPLIPYQNTYDGYLYGFFISQANVFMFGFILFYLNRLIKLKYLLYLLIGLLPLLISYLNGFKSGIENNILITILFGCFFIIIQKPNYSFLQFFFIRYLGKLSYSIYLIHFVVLALFEKFHFKYFISNISLNYSIRFMFVLIISIIISNFSYKYIEQPFIGFGKRIIAKYD